jgi:alpha-D-ribose 1-methylphosphonate 5-triphosphate diphosphatase
MAQILPAATHHHATEPCLRIVNCTLVTPERVIENGSLQVDKGRIARLQEGGLAGCGPRIDAAGAMLIPGFVDIHCDANEKAIHPRPGAQFPAALALQELDKVLASCGVTTIYHCVAFSNGQKGLRAVRAARSLIQSIQACRNRLSCTTHVHLRYDITLREALPVVSGLIDDGVVKLFSFMDHTPGQGQFSTYEVFRNYLGRHHQYTEEEVREVVKKRIADREAVDEDALRSLGLYCRSKGIPVASHDDDTPEKVDRLCGMGVTISEFPVTLTAARAANRRGMRVAMGAPNLLMGKSTNDNLTAMAVAGDGLLDIVCSDYAPMTLLHAALKLARSGLMTLPQAIAAFTLNPAEAAGIGGDTGSLTEGKAADMVLVDVTAPVPRVLKTFVAGKPVYSLC